MSLVEKDCIFLKDSFESVLEKLCYEKVPTIGCKNHLKVLMVDVIYQYVLLRCRCLAKKKMMKEIEKEKNRLHDQRKFKKIRKGTNNKRR